MEEEKRRKRGGMETEILETIAFAATAALFISGMKLFLSLVFRRWSATTAAPPLLLSLLIHLIVASIVLVSIHQSLFTPSNHRYMRRRSHRSKRKNSSVKEKNKWEDEEEEEAEDKEGVDADELNAKVEAFIKEFRQQLRIESFSSRFEASN
ncbi:hypothetical protein MA16_Dca024542 [Dendrobium catenatum]|uniref:DUF4408 domain-containing protein n=1 Tax=Dendrobium catenatum TaxID=906689 RepID=A0A2I0WE33_9ASPA|nr:hypothetical protein MA16_Dca024542 [Dendrobium catenatum]